MPAPRSRITRRYRAAEQAGLVRIIFAISALVFAGSMCPFDTTMRDASFVYLLGALVFQVVLRRDWAAGPLRGFGMSLVDIAFLSFLTFLLGPATNVLPSGYLLIPAVHAASSSSSTSASRLRAQLPMVLAAIGSLSYVALLILVGLEILPYGPGRPDHPIAQPPPSQLLASGAQVVLSVLLTTHIVLRHMRALDRMNRQLEELAQVDDLTGLYNRRHLFAELRRQLERVARGAQCGVLMIDLDGFKRVNDELGHDAGDLLLRDIAGALTSETRTVDLVARYGGDEFVVVLPDLAPGDALPVAERVVAAVEKVGRARWPTTPVTASIGVAVSRSDDDVAALLRRADAQAYAAKRAGGNRVALSHEDRLLTTAEDCDARRSLSHETSSVESRQRRA